MKEIHYSSTFKAEFSEVKKNFNKNLFEFLLPKVLPTKILRYDGHETGDQIHLQLANKVWISKITKVNDFESEYNFTDEGERLPLPLKKWHHKHRVVKVNESEVTVIDEISFDCGNKVLNNILYPILFAQFIPRISLYKKYFEEKLYEN
jgi:ligand-binding SRPBCC domain-containing protein